MSTITFTGVSSVLDRTVFVNKGSITKPPLPLLSGSNLYVKSPTTFEIPTANFTSTSVGNQVVISGSSHDSNNGTFTIEKVINAHLVQCSDASFTTINLDLLISKCFSLANEIKSKFNAHLIRNNVHLNADIYNTILSSDAIDIYTLVALTTELLEKIQTHAYNGPMPFVNPPVPYDPNIHYFSDPNYKIYTEVYVNSSIYLTLNALHARFMEHIQNRFFHLNDDFDSKLSLPQISVPTGGPGTGPLAWILIDPRTAQIADDPSDVTVTLNGSNPASVDAVFGLLGAVVLTDKPSPGDQVGVTYQSINNLPTQFERLNSSEFVLNQEKNRSASGLPDHQYRQRSFLLDPVAAGSTVRSPYEPKKTGYKYKAIERSYTAALNDPTTLLLNVPNNRIMYPVFDTTVSETNVRYDPITLPQNSSDAWVFNGDGSAFIDVPSKTLVIRNETVSQSVVPGSPFYSHPIDLTYSSDIQMVSRFLVSDSEVYLYSGDYSGVGFGLTDGQKATIVGAIKSTATNLSSAITIANDIKLKYSSHIVNTGVHKPNDTLNVIALNDAHDLSSLINLLVHMKTTYNSHLTEGPNNIHQNLDLTDLIIIDDPTDESSAIAFTNSLRNVFNAHLTKLGVHYVDDEVNSVQKTYQVGILTKNGLPQDAYSWASSSHDFTVETSYRLFKDINGNAFLYLAGNTTEIASVQYEDLPNAADVSLKLNPIHQVFFGSLDGSATNSSNWKFVRANIIPATNYQVGKNKSVSYYPSVLPEDESTYPWVSIGQGGTEFLSTVPTNRLIVDSMSYVTLEQSESSGNVNGEYKAYLRTEPVLNESNFISVEFSTSCDYRSFGVDNRSLGVFINDGTFATSLSFIQADPKPATILGSVIQPSVSVKANDLAIFSINDGYVITLRITSLIDLSTYPDPIQQIADLINLAAEQEIAFAQTTNAGIVLRITGIQNDSLKGSSTSVRIIEGSVWAKCGIKQGTYRGTDSNPEPKVSWSGMSAPELDYPNWVVSGTAPSEVIERVLKISDESSTSYKLYTANNINAVPQIVKPDGSWKSDFRVKVDSYVPGALLNVACAEIYHCGPMFIVDEGPGQYPNYGKNVYAILCEDTNKQGYINIRSRDPSDAYELKQIAIIPFSWNDGNYHSFNLFKSFDTNLVSVYADSVYLANFSYNDLLDGADGPSIKFGTGDGIINDIDLSLSKSISSWSSVSIIKDSNQLPENRYIGLYRGGDASLLSSYYLHQINWGVNHTYRLVRDPVSGVTVYVDDNQVPVISAQYDVLTLPASSIDFISNIVPNGKCISFGAFSPFEISRSSWGGVNYSVGRLTSTNGLVPSHNLLNTIGVIASSEHLKSPLPHDHRGFKSYSGGSPTDDFLSSPNLLADTQLYDNTPPMIKTQSLEYRGGLTLLKTPLESIANVGLVDSSGDIGSKENDDVNVVTVPDAVGPIAAGTQFIADVNALILKYQSHIASSDPHDLVDTFNNTIIVPYTLADCFLSLQDIAYHQSLHITNNPFAFHFHADSSHTVPVKLVDNLNDAVDYFNEISRSIKSHIESTYPHYATSSFDDSFLPDYIASVNQIRLAFDYHITNVPGSYHISPDNIDVIGYSLSANDLPSAVLLANLLKSRFNDHISSVAYHLTPDVGDTIIAPDATDITSLGTLIDELTLKYNIHIPDTTYHPTGDSSNSVTLYTTWEYAVRVAEQVTESFNGHVLSVIAHQFPDAESQVVSSPVYDLKDTGSGLYFDTPSIIDWISSIKQNVYNHVVKSNQDGNSIHFTDDFVSANLVSLILNPVDAISSAQCIKTIRDVLSLHHVPGVASSVTTPYRLAHNVLKSDDIPDLSYVQDPVVMAKALVDDIIGQLNQHIIKSSSHLKIKPAVSEDSL